MFYLKFPIIVVFSMFFFVFIKVNNTFAPNFIIDFSVRLLSKCASRIEGPLVIIMIIFIHICLFEFHAFT